jgi:dephospho-coA kinase
VDRALRVGLTGGIGAGKSTVAALLEAHGAVVTSADEISRDVVSPGSDGLAAVVAEFGDDVLTPAGTLDRRALGNLVFANDLSRARLEEILLPLIAAEAWARMEAVPAGRVAVYDVPLLVEGQMQDLFDLVVVVEADLELRLERLAERGMEREKALARIASQATDDERRAVADIVLSNSGSIDQLSADVDRLWSTRIMVAGTNV